MSRNEVIGISAGILSGAAYGTNALFGKPLMEAGVSVTDMLLMRYALAVVIVTCIACLHQPSGVNSLRIRLNQLPMLNARPNCIGMLVVSLTNGNTLEYLDGGGVVYNLSAAQP